ncbi:MAG: hypothetical protein VYB09_08310 [Planctomycetota bacterium]|nr:hypothetical protein [Planctomycetota bacterium]
MAGWMELGLLVFSTLGGPFTLGIPPGEMDPQLHNLVPEQCLVFHQWAPATEARAESDNRLEQLIAEPDVQLVVARLGGELKRLVSEFPSRDKSPGAIPFSQLLLHGAETLHDHPGAFYAWRSPQEEGPGAIRVAMVVRAEKDAARFDSLLTALLKAVAGENVSGWEAGEGHFQKAVITPDSPPLVWGQRGDYFLVFLGETSANETLGRWQNAPPDWLAGILERVPLKRRSTLTFLDLQQATGLAESWLGDSEDVDRILQATGLANLRHVALTTGMAGPDWVSHALISLDGEPEGLLKSLLAGNLARADLEQIPADVLLALGWKFHLGESYESGLRVARSFNPQAADDFNEIIQLVEEELDLKLHEDLLQSLGDQWTLYCSRQGSLATGWTATVAVNNRDVVEKVLLTLGRALEGFGPDAPRVHKEKLGDATLFILDIPDDDVLVLPSFALTDQQLVLGLFPQAVREHLRRPPGNPSLADNPQVKELFLENRRVVGCAISDNKGLFEFAYPAAQTLFHSASTSVFRNRPPLGPRDGKALANPGAAGNGKLDGALLPSAESISRHLGQERLVLYVDPDGIHFEQRGDIPGNLLLPAMLPLIWLNTSSSGQAAPERVRIQVK